MDISRRKVLQGAGAGITAGVAGCSARDDDSQVTTEEPQETDAGDQETPDAAVGGEPVRELTLLTYPQRDNPNFHDVAQRSAENWRELGLTVTVEPIDFNAAIEAVLIEHDYDMWTISWGDAEGVDPEFWLSSVYNSSQINPGAYNFVQWSNERWDELAELVKTTIDDDERRELVYEAQELWASEQPGSPYYVPSLLEPYNSDTVDPYDEKMLGQGQTMFWNIMNLESNRDENTLILGETSTLDSLNPLNTAHTASRDFQQFIYDRLLRRRPNLESEPWAAESYQMVDDTTIRVSLRDDLQFHDGEDVTAEDVKFSFEYQQEYAPITSTYLADLSEVEVLDDLNLEFRLSNPSSSFIPQGLAFVFILPKHIWENVPDGVDADEPTDWTNPEMIGSGPFVFQEYTREERAVAVANEDHFNPPNIDRYIQQYGPRESLYRSLEQGAIDVVANRKEWELTSIERLSRLDNVSLYEAPNHGYLYIAYNNAREPFSDTTFRRALANGIPKTTIGSDLFGGYGSVAHGTITETNERWHNPDIEKFGMEWGGLEAAREELEQAGYSWDDDGRLLHPSD